MSQEERRNEPFIGEATILECQYFQKNETLAYLGISNLFKTRNFGIRYRDIAGID
jgi:hypothetical protein